MRRALLSMLSLAACAWLINPAVSAQQTFRSTTALLVLDVSVLDRDGNPVPDLQPEDLVISLNGEIAPVRTMAFLATQIVNATTTARRPGTEVQSRATPTTVGTDLQPDPKLFVLMVDDVSIYPTESKGLMVAAERFVDSVPPRDWVGLTTTSGLTTVNPSPDRTLLMTKLKRTFGQMFDPRRASRPVIGLMEALLADQSGTMLRDLIQTHCHLPSSMSETEIFINQCAEAVARRARANAAFARNNTRNQLDTYAAVIKRMASAPGVKELVILTGGIALTPNDSVDFIPVAKAAAAAGVQITILMEDPDQIDVSLPEGAATVVDDQRRMVQEAETLADMSGGQFFRVIGQADRFYQRILRSASSIYRIGVDLPQTPPKGDQYTLKVVVKRPGVKAFASRYASPPVAPVSLTPEEKMKHAITTGELAYAVPVQMSAEIVPLQKGSPLAIRVVVEVPGATPGPISGMFGIVGPDRQLRSGHQDPVRSTDGKSYRLDLLVPVAVGVYDLRLAVSDGLGAVGAVSQKVVVK